MFHTRQVADRESFLTVDGVSSDLAGCTLRGGVATGVPQVSRFLLSVCGTVVLARLVAPSDYGLIGMVAAFTTFVAIFREP
jgi:hypothetical protein